MVAKKSSPRTRLYANHIMVVTEETVQCWTKLPKTLDSIVKGCTRVVNEPCNVMHMHYTTVSWTKKRLFVQSETRERYAEDISNSPHGLARREIKRFSDNLMWCCMFCRNNDVHFQFSLEPTIVYIIEGRRITTCCCIFSGESKYSFVWFTKTGQ